jgi:hypothetical protein
MNIYTLRPDIFTLTFNFTLSGTLLAQCLAPDAESVVAAAVQRLASVMLQDDEQEGACGADGVYYIFQSI